MDIGVTEPFADANALFDWALPSPRRTPGTRPAAHRRFGSTRCGHRARCTAVASPQDSPKSSSPCSKVASEGSPGIDPSTLPGFGDRKRKRGGNEQDQGACETMKHVGAFRIVQGRTGASLCLERYDDRETPCRLPAPCPTRAVGNPMGAAHLCVTGRVTQHQLTTTTTISTVCPCPCRDYTTGAVQRRQVEDVAV